MPLGGARKMSWASQAAQARREQRLNETCEPLHPTLGRDRQSLFRLALTVVTANLDLGFSCNIVSYMRYDTPIRGVPCMWCV